MISKKNNDTNVAVIVLNWNNSIDTIKCVESLLAGSLVPRVFIVDNDSNDDSVKNIVSFVSGTEKGDIQFIVNKQNLGFAGGINCGVKKALDLGFDFIGSVNPDATVDTKAIESLIDCLSPSSSRGISTGSLLSASGELIDSVGEKYSSWGMPFPTDRNQPKNKLPHISRQITAASGGFFMARRSVFETVGYFDEDFFMYYEDVDFCLRAQLAGFKVLYTPSAVAYHATGSSSKNVPGLIIESTFRNLPILLVKNVPSPFLWLILPKFIVLMFVFFIKSIARGDSQYSVDGIWQAIRCTKKTLRKRHSIQTHRIVSLSYFRSLIYKGLPPRNR